MTETGGTSWLGSGGSSGDDPEPECGTWRSPLGSWLRGIVDDPSSVVPSVGRVFDALRVELEKTPVLGVLFIRLDYWGIAADLCGWADKERVYRVVSSVTVDMMGKGLRRVDLPADIGLHGEGFAVFLSAPRGETVLEPPVVDVVGDRVATRLRERLVQELPAEVAQRLTIEVGSGLVRRPKGSDTLEDVVLSGLVAADAASRSRQQAHLREVATHLERVLEQGLLQVTYQPVVDAGAQRVVGFEAFASGPPQYGMHLGDVLLDAARRSGLGFRAYDAYHQAAVAGAEGDVTDDDVLLLQVSASELLESAVRGLALLFRRGTTYLTPTNVVFMVDAADVAAHFPPVLAASRSVADMGFRLCVHLSPDGPVPFDLLRELHPDFLRVGARTIRGLGRNQDEFELLLMLSRFAGRHGIRMMATDCSDRAELLALRRSGVDLVQGDVLGPRAERPAKAGVVLP